MCACMLVSIYDLSGVNHLKILRVFASMEGNQGPR